jgi:hypothetical protein
VLAHAGLLALLDSSSAAMSVIPMPRIGAEPPTEFRAFAWGDNGTNKGTLKLTKAGAAKAMQNYAWRGRPLCFDLWHSTYAKPGDVSPQDRFAVGHFKLETRADGVWYADIQWVPQYAQEIREGKWPFISPAVMHTKEGEIFEFKNAGLVTDPGLLNPLPTILSGLAGTSSKGPPMDKKRMMMDCFAAMQMAMKRCQALGDSDGADKELAQKMTAGMAPMMEMMSAHMGQAGYMMDEAMMSGAALEGGVALVASLAAELKESEPAKLGALLLAKLDAMPGPVAAAKVPALSDADAKLLVTCLDAFGAERVPAARRHALIAAGPIAYAMYLSANPTAIAPSGGIARESAPLPPTVANVEASLKDAPPAPGAKSGKPTTLSACSPQQRIFVDAQLQMAKQFQGEKFDEKYETDLALAALSGVEPVTTNQIRCMPYGPELPTTLAVSN